MHELFETIGKIGIVPVIKIESASKAPALGRALVAGGIPVAEVTFRTDAAGESIRAIVSEVPGILVGAGTVLSVEQARAAKAAGARFIVSPAYVDAVVDYCIDEGLPVLPGVAGPDGVAKGVGRGLTVFKFFPAEASGGVAMLDAISAPFGGVKFVPTGGIDSSNIGAYARRPQILAVGGSWMVKPDMVESADWGGVERLCREAVSALHGFAFAHLGVNCEDEGASRSASARFGELFGLAAKEGASSIFAGDSIELTKRLFPGAKGHIAIKCNDVERAVARFARAGIGVKADTAKSEKGKMKAIYLDLELGGFAIHLLRA